MRPTVVDLFDKLADYKGDPKKDLNKLTIGEIKRIIHKLNELSKDFSNMVDDFEKGDLRKQSRLKTVQEAAQILGVTKQTIYNKIAEESIKCLKHGRSIRIPIEELNKYFSFITVPGLMAFCIKDFIFVDKKTFELLPFEEGNHYRITSENLIWIYLFNAKWGDRAKISKKEFRKYFKMADEQQVWNVRLGLDDLS